MVPNLKVRELNRNELEKDIEIYATAISKVYHQIQNYLSGMYELNTQYDLQHLFGVIVMLDDIALSRSKIYSKAFEVYSKKYGSLSMMRKSIYIAILRSFLCDRLKRCF